MKICIITQQDDPEKLRLFSEKALVAGVEVVYAKSRNDVDQACDLIVDGFPNTERDKLICDSVHVLRQQPESPKIFIEKKRKGWQQRPYKYHR